MPWWPSTRSPRSEAQADFWNPTRGTEEFAWITSHSYRKTAATLLDEAGLTARQIAYQLGHSRPSLTQDVYMARGVADPHAAKALE